LPWPLDANAFLPLAFLADESAVPQNAGGQDSGATSMFDFLHPSIRMLLIETIGYYGEQPATSSGFWTIEYYQKYFDVDTKMVFFVSVFVFCVVHPFRRF
jgi:hypothetical protein